MLMHQKDLRDERGSFLLVRPTAHVSNGVKDVCPSEFSVEGNTVVVSAAAGAFCIF